MEENKDVATEGGLSAKVVSDFAKGLHAGRESSAQSGVCADSAKTAAGMSGVAKGRNMAGKVLTVGRHSAEKRLRASGGLHAQDRLRAVREPSAERRLHVADRLHTQDGVGATGAYAPRCDQCRKPILRLETYIAVGCVTLCDSCYMNMGTGEFLAKIGGELRVME